MTQVAAIGSTEVVLVLGMSVVLLVIVVALAVWLARR
jgi:hypothetical protein